MISVSVIIPVYNSEKYLEKCLDSVCGQTLKDIEIICVNDCSQDSSLSILKRYASIDERIVVVDSKENRGAATSRNAAIRMARGKYLAFVDSDDFIDLDFLEKLYTKALETGADIVKGDRKIFDTNTGVSTVEEGYWKYMNDKLKEHKAYFYWAWSAAIYDRELVIANDVHFLDGLEFFEDSYFSIKASIFNKKTELVLDAYYHYTSNPSSVCHKGKMLSHFQDRCTGTSLILDLLESSDISKEHYLIVCEYLFMEMHMNVEDMSLSDDITRLTSQALVNIIKRCRYPEDMVSKYFLSKKERNRREHFSLIRKFYKK